MNLSHLKHIVFEVGVSYYIAQVPSTKSMGDIDFLCESTQKYSETTSVGNRESITGPEQAFYYVLRNLRKP